MTVLVLMALAQPASSHRVGSSSVISSSSILGGGCGKRCEAVSPAGSQAGLFLASQRLGMAGPPPSLPSGRPTAIPSPLFTPWRFELHSTHMQWETLNGRRELGPRVHLPLPSAFLRPHLGVPCWDFVSQQEEAWQLLLTHWLAGIPSFSSCTYCSHFQAFPLEVVPGCLAAVLDDHINSWSPRELLLQHEKYCCCRGAAKLPQTIL